MLERVRNLLPFNSGTARLLSDVYVIQGRIEEGFAEAERALEIEGFESWDVASGTLILLSTDDRDQLLNWLARAEHYIPEPGHEIALMKPGQVRLV